MIKLYSDRRRYVFTLIMTVLASMLLSYLEYYYVRVDLLPAREATTPLFGPFFGYQVIVFIPLILLVAFQPLIQDTLLKLRTDRLRTTLPLGLACSLLGLIMEDSTWFTFRALSPMPMDPMAYSWIRPLDYTASASGYVPVLGAVIPIWYFALAPVIIAVFAALLVP